MMMTKRKKAAMRTRENIIKAASTLMEENTLNDIMVEDITKAAGVSKGTFYTYFKKKEDIVDAVGLGPFQKINEAIERMTSPIEVKIRYFFVEYLKSYFDSGKNLTKEYLINDLTKQEDQHFQYDQSKLTDLFEDAKKRQELKAETPIDDLVQMILSVIYGMCYLWSISDAQADLNQKATAVYDHLIDQQVRRYKR